MTSDSAECAAVALLDARRHRRWLDKLPEGCIPETSEDAYLIQERVVTRLGPIGGYKAGATAPGASQRGSLVFKSLIYASPASVPAESLRIFGVEAEFAFSFGAHLPRRLQPYTEDEVLDAIEAVHASIEIVESRFADWQRIDGISKLADNGSNGGVVLGPAYRDWRSVDFAQAPVSLRIDEMEVAKAIGGRGGLHPLSGIAWLANTYAPRFGGIRQGQIVMTGSCTGITIAKAGATVVADLARLGQATVVFKN